MWVMNHLVILFFKWTFHVPHFQENLQPILVNFQKPWKQCNKNWVLIIILWSLSQDQSWVGSFSGSIMGWTLSRINHGLDLFQDQSWVRPFPRSIMGWIFSRINHGLDLFQDQSWVGPFSELIMDWTVVSQQHRIDNEPLVAFIYLSPL